MTFPIKKFFNLKKSMPIIHPLWLKLEVCITIGISWDKKKKLYACRQEWLIFTDDPDQGQ